MADKDNVPEMIRVSIGSAIVLGLIKGNLDALPTTAYLLTYRQGKCMANCGFCPQAKNSTSRADMLSRVTWPLFPTSRVIDVIGNAFKQDKIKRACIQALNYPAVFDEVLSTVSRLRSRCKVSISVSCQPLDIETLKRLAEAGVERIGIPLDAATKKIFGKIKGKQAKGPYVWEKQMETLTDAVKIFGKGMVSTHLMVGLGETEKDMTRIIQHCVDMGVYPSLFAFTPVAGTALEFSSSPSLNQYRRIQLAQYLIAQGETKYDRIRFGKSRQIIDFGVSKETLHQTIKSGTPFLTSGCPNCNRPYYNEKPGGPVYNYPRMLMEEDIEEIEKVFKQ